MLVMYFNFNPEHSSCMPFHYTEKRLSIVLDDNMCSSFYFPYIYSNKPC